ncbi:MAG: prepilin-type N-terminal cleavage/methylation domain-containing protein [Planctomycetota bacterium]
MQSAKWLMRWSGMKPIQPPARSDRRPAGRRGFTLVELLVVISIIGLLIGIVVPVVSKARGAAEKVTCSSCLRQIGLVIESYTIEHKEKYPVAKYMPDPFVSTSTNPPITEVLDGYIDLDSEEAKVYKCPDDDQVYDLAGISYEYNFSLNGKTLEEFLNSGRLRRMNVDASKMMVMRDFDNGEFLLNDGSTISVPMRHIGRNILFADGHVGKLEF